MLKFLALLCRKFTNITEKQIKRYWIRSLIVFVLSVILMGIKKNFFIFQVANLSYYAQTFFIILYIFKKI